ncbi:hypothetical protein [Marinobacter sp. BGYM27]|uniref:hypothetical protein n=1 Tax=unclassified Marinobacter TaxID=83889 RepID=UPI0021A6CFF2|nr:hypothetical protein [Marinobacter sp. BGYM27]MDG5501176.1 hypothetical protein [Marinobacter sp. BGYM27]
MVTPRMHGVIVAAISVVLAACSTTGDKASHATHQGAATSTPKAQFECADRNGNEYIDRAELVYLEECGIGENLSCGSVAAADPKDQQGAAGTREDKRANFEDGRRQLEVMDADRDNRISKLEFRAHCSNTAADK